MLNYDNNKEKINKPKIIILSSPSGGGKTTIAKKLSEINQNMIVSISATTRKKNQSEIEGKDYFFISKEEFSEQIQKDNFLEYAEIYGNYYGTIKKSVYDVIKNDKYLIFDIDWQGHRSIKERILDIDIISFFILPPSLEILTDRLKKRNRDDDEMIDKRLEQAQNEMRYKNEYDHIIINNDLDKAIEEIENIINKLNV